MKNLAADTKQFVPAFLPNGFHIQGESVLYPDYIPQPGDSLLDLIDSNSQFSAAPVPESPTLVTIALGAILLFCSNRFRYRRSPSAALV